MLACLFFKEKHLFFVKIHIPGDFRPEKVYGMKGCCLPLTLKETILISYLVSSF